MSEREELTGPRAPARGASARTLGALAALAVPALVAAGCGGDDFENNPRPPLPVELTAKVDSQAIEISPSEVGGGLINLTISNLTDSGVVVTLDHQDSGAKSVSSNEIPANGVDTLKADVEEGTYLVSAQGGDELGSDRLVVGPDRPASTNELLSP